MGDQNLLFSQPSSSSVEKINGKEKNKKKDEDSISSDNDVTAGLNIVSPNSSP